MRPRPNVLSVLVLAALAVALASCGGDSSSGGDDQPIPPPAGTPIMLSGFALYERPTVQPGTTGLDFTDIRTLPIRGAMVEIRDASGRWTWYRARTDVDGSFAIQAPPSHAVTLVVLAAIGPDAATIDTRVVDGRDATYALARAFTTPATGQAIADITADTGWTGGASGSYTATRAAAPFAILDTVYEAQALVTDVAATTFPPLRVQWTPTGTDGTYFIPSQQRIVVLGSTAGQADTDEFDAHVVAHEWGHYWEDNFSRSDSLGGPHQGGDILDERVSFGEGFGNAFSGMVLDDPRYIDTKGVGAASFAAIDMDMEGDAQSGTDEGAWSETTVQELLWDLYDANADGEALSLGFGPIHDVMRNGQRTTPAFTTIYSFLYHLKLVAGQGAAIDALAATENILAYDEYQETAAGRRRYIDVPNDGTPVSTGLNGSALSTSELYGPTSRPAPGETRYAAEAGNKRFNWQWFKATAPSGGGSSAFKATPTQEGDLAIIRGGPVFGYADTFTDATPERLTVAGGTTLVFSVGAFSEDAEAFTVRFGTAATVTKPAAEAEEAPAPAPNGNG